MADHSWVLHIWRLKSPTSWLFTQAFIQARIKENIKAMRHWPLCGEIHRSPVNSPHKGLATRKLFPFDDVIIYFRDCTVESGILCWNDSTVQSWRQTPLLSVLYCFGELICYAGYVESKLFLSETNFGLRVLSLSVSGCVCVCVCVYQSLACPLDNSGPVQARITKFGPKMRNTLVEVPGFFFFFSFLLLLFFVLFLFVFSFAVWNLNLQSLNLPHFEFVPNITHHPYKLGSPNLNQMCKIHWLISLLFWWQLTLTFKVKFELKSPIFWLHHYWKYITTIKPPESHE